jgi:hypothetical protein
MNSIKSGIGIAALSGVCFLLVLISDVSANDLILTADNANIGNIVIVSPKAGSSATDKGTALLNALAGINDASSGNKYLIKIGPGTFNLGTSSLQMRQYVDIEGSGKELTVITGSGQFTVRGASRGTLSKLGVNNTNTSNAYAIYNDNGLLFVEDVSVDARNGSGFNIGIFNLNSNLFLEDSSILALTPNGFAIYNGGGPYANQIRRSILSGFSNAVYNAAGYVVDIVFSQLETPSVNFGAGNFSCFQNYNSGFTAATCP